MLHRSMFFLMLSIGLRRSRAGDYKPRDPRPRAFPSIRETHTAR